MNALDLVLAALVGLGAWRGYKSGLGKQLVSTVGLFLAFVAGAALMGDIGQLLSERFSISERIAPVVGFIVVFVGILGLVAGALRLFRKLLEAAKLSAVDTLAGAALGGLKAALNLSIMLLVTGFSPLAGGDPLLIGAETREGSMLYDPIEAVAPETWNLIQTFTPGIQEALLDKFNSWRDGDDDTRPVRVNAAGNQTTTFST